MTMLLRYPLSSLFYLIDLADVICMLGLVTILRMSLNEIIKVVKTVLEHTSGQHVIYEIIQNHYWLPMATYLGSYYFATRIAETVTLTICPNMFLGFS